MNEIKCAECRTVIYLDDGTLRHRREDGQVFYCPNGHENVFRPSEVDRLKKQVEFLGNKNTELWAELKSLEHVINGYRGQLAKMKKKIKALEDGHNAANKVQRI